MGEEPKNPRTKRKINWSGRRDSNTRPSKRGGSASGASDVMLYPSSAEREARMPNGGSAAAAARSLDRRNKEIVLRKEIGRPNLSTHAFSQVHDFIELSFPHRSAISKKTVEISENQKSQRWIARKLNLSRARVATILKNRSSFRLRGGLTPLGFDYVDSKIVENPRELHIVRIIIELWNGGSGPSAIARKLERLKLKTRRGGRWDHSLVIDIIVRAQDKSGPYSNVAKVSRCYIPRKSPKRPN